LGQLDSTQLKISFFIFLGQTAPLHQGNVIQDTQKDDSNDNDEAKPLSILNSDQDVVIS
jgi:hypothetical protein